MVWSIHNNWRKKLFFAEEMKHKEGKYRVVEKTKKREGKGRKYFVKDNIFYSVGENREGKGGKYLENDVIWSKEDKKKGEGELGKYLEKENNFFFSGRGKNGEGKGGKYLEKGNEW